jgi:hypothetical protein
MKLLGFNYTKINVEKLKDAMRDLKINSQVDISDIERVNQEIFKSQEGFLAVKFKYKIEYAPGIAVINLEGTILISIDSKLAKDVLKQWKDKKAMTEEFKMPLFNIILQKTGLKSLRLEEEMGLPLHIQLPFLKKNDDSGKK